MVGRSPELSPRDIDALRQIDTPTISNAIDSLGARDPTEGFASLDLRCLFPDLPPTVGYAVTCTDDSSVPRANKGRGYQDLYSAIEASPKPVVVVFKSAVNPKRSLHMGEVMAAVCARLGAVGVVTDGGVRDLQGVRQTSPDFQMFATGIVPAGGAPNLIDVNVTVAICGLTIRPGDLLHGDENGLIGILSGSPRQQLARPRPSGRVKQRASHTSRARTSRSRAWPRATDWLARWDHGGDQWVRRLPQTRLPP